MSSSAFAFAAALPAAARGPLLARLAAALAGVLLAIVLARLVWLLLSGPAVPLDEAMPHALPPARSDAGPAESIAQWHLFGNAAPIHRAVELQAPETALRLFLRGTVNEGEDGAGIAIISDADGGERAYRVGDALPGGAELTAVHAGRVLLSRNGTTEQLSLPVDTTVGASATTSPAGRGALPTGQPASGGIAPYISPVISPVNPIIATGGPQIGAAQRASLPDLEALAQQVTVLPVIENGRFAGVRLAAGRDSGLLSRAGLKPTDIVTSVNGIPLDGPQRQQQLLDSLQGSNSVQLTVRRDGKDVQLNVGLK